MGNSKKPGPISFLCSANCGNHQTLETLDVFCPPGGDLVAAMEAAAETEHFLASGCRGSVKMQEKPGGA